VLLFIESDFVTGVRLPVRAGTFLDCGLPDVHHTADSVSDDSSTRPGIDGAMPYCFTALSVFSVTIT